MGDVRSFNSINGPVKILRLRNVKEVVGLSKSTIYMRIAEGGFPAPINLGGRAVGWIESEVRSWLCSQVELSRPATSLHLVA